MLDVSASPFAAAAARHAPTFSVVVPVYNEAACIAAFHRRLAPVMNRLGAWEVVYVNDGSDDATLAELEALRCTDPHIALLNLSRNFGKEIATSAGLDHASGQAVIVIDADLQDPPEVIPDLVAAWRDGCDTAYAQRRARAGETRLKRLTAHLFYRLMRHAGRVQLPSDTGDFRLMSRRVVDAVRQLREQHRFMKGLFAWVGFPARAVPYDRQPRHAGRSSWSYWRLWNLALEGITSFTVMPLKVATYLGVLVAGFAVAYGTQVVLKTLLFGNPVAGYPSLMAVVLFLGGVQLTTLGVMGEYLGRIFNETKRRPLYLVERFVGAAGAPVRSAGIARGATDSAAPSAAMVPPSANMVPPLRGMAAPPPVMVQLSAAMIPPSAAMARLPPVVAGEGRPPTTSPFPPTRQPEGPGTRARLSQAITGEGER